VRRGLAFILLGLLLASCEGLIGDAGGSFGDSNGAAGVGSASQAALLRLSKEQHRRTVESLLDRFLGEQAGPVLDAVDPVYAIIPDDSTDLDFAGLVGSTFSRMSQAVGELHIRGYFDVASTVASAIVQDPTRRQMLFGDCIDEPSPAQSGCLDDFLDSFGMWTMRRPLDEDERSFFIDTVFADEGRDYEASPEALTDLITALMSSPNFLYQIQDRGEDLGKGLYELDPYELASRLSYHFWNSMPDQELFDAAADGSLLREDEYAAQVERVYEDPRTHDTFEQFFYEWLELDQTGDVYAGVTAADPMKMAFIDGMHVTHTLRDNMIQEVLDMTQYYRGDGTFEDLFTSTESFARTNDLAQIYEVPTWDGLGAPPEFPSTERIGLLGRAALLAAATVETHPILRGVRIRENFLCDALGAPPANASQMGGDDSSAGGLRTTRERTEDLTSPGSCWGCHSQINGLGFPLERFDSLGRERVEEMVVVPEGGMAMLEVDTGAVPYINGASDVTLVEGPVELSEELLDSGKLQSCFAQHYVRFTLGLLADPSQGGDQGTIDALEAQMVAGTTLSELFKGIAHTPAFKQRLTGEQS
jgi:hypothetical protein